MAFRWCLLRNGPSRYRVVIVITLTVSLAILFYTNCLTMFELEESGFVYTFKTNERNRELNIRYNLLEETSVRRLLQNNLFNESQCNLGKKNVIHTLISSQIKNRLIVNILKRLH